MTDLSRRTALTGIGTGAALATLPRQAHAATATAPTASGETHPPRPHEVAVPGSTSRDRAWARRILRRMTLEQKVGQLFTCYVHGTDAERVTEAEAAENTKLFGVRSGAEAVARYHLGGVIYFAWSDNLKDPEQIAGLSNGLQRAALASGARVPLTISVDQEHGAVFRIGRPATLFPGAMALGATRSVRDANLMGQVAGRELRAMGITTDYAPVADVNVDPANPVIGVRSPGSDPGLVSSIVKGQVTGLQRKGGVSATAKHFPGHGDTSVDSHAGLPTITHTRAEWERLDRPPFEAAIKAGVESIMTAHLLVPALDDSGDPATLSPKIITGVLRKEMGFRGLVVTDGLMMAGVRQKYGDDEVAVRAVLAGADVLLQSPDVPKAYAAVLAAAKSGRIPMRRLEDSVLRNLQYKAVRGVVARPLVDVAKVASVVGTTAHGRIAADVADHSTTLLRNTGVLPITPRGRRIALVGWSSGTVTHEILADSLEQRGVQVTLATTGADPTAQQIDAAVAAAEDAEGVLVTTYNVKPDSPQAKLVAALQASGRPVVVAALRNPYDIAHFPSVPAYLATYSWTPSAIEALVRTLVGENDPTGKLPVDIPAANGSTLYRYGAGLSY
ncbi:glycoside hydrolase family 3 protein [Mobilicoccus caccae]|uniref:beta-N-acetylhexosaminidase n=1 Tax=Mobilicoccus caccae TaxID=1859295 RepID=A0ABQ6IWY3_9MICO|nr:glycoside hydrolase family 3 protein [Mobilicoccus caccae]GMA41946.1 beta-N-acetylhexosaminidase [Mobilicoccus caccae]